MQYIIFINKGLARERERDGADIRDTQKTTSCLGVTNQEGYIGLMYGMGETNTPVLSDDTNYYGKKKGVKSHSSCVGPQLTNRITHVV